MSSSRLSVLRPHVRGFALAASTLLALCACVVIPIDPAPGRPYDSPYTPTQDNTGRYNAQRARQAPMMAAPPIVQLQPVAPAAMVLSGRLYPVNPIASPGGLLNAQAVDSGTGRATFSVNAKGQSLQGEATRVGKDHPGFGRLLAQVNGSPAPNSSADFAQMQGQRGIANAASPDGLSLQCEYLLTKPAQGTGVCVMSDGGYYQLHFGR